MFVVIYRYRVPKEKMKQYILIERQLIALYSEHGCLGVEIFRDARNPRYWMEINRFRDKDHYEEVVAAVDKDPRIVPLTKEFMFLFEKDEYKPEMQVYFKML